MRRPSVVVLVVMVLVGIGLLAHAIQHSRYKQNQIECVNNLKCIGTGMDNFHSLYHRFPAATASDLWHRKDGAPAVPHDQRMSWLLEVTRFSVAIMDRKWQIDNSKPWDAQENEYVALTEFPFYHCPAAPGGHVSWSGSKSSLLTYYVGIAGIGKEAIHLPLADPNCGMFGYNRKVTRDDITDGVSTTMAAAETAQANDRWAKPGHATVRGLDPDGGPYLGATGQFNSHHLEGFWSKRCRTLILLVDASCRVLPDDVSPRVFEALATIRGGEEIEPGEW